MTWEITPTEEARRVGLTETTLGRLFAAQFMVLKRFGSSKDVTKFVPS